MVEMDMRDVATSTLWDRAAVAVIAVGTIFRFVWGVLVHPPLHYVYSDMGGYIDRAMRLASGANLSRFDTFYPPGTHIILALPLWIFGHGQTGLWAASVLMFLLSACVPVLAWRVALRLVSRRAAGIAAILCAIWPLFITYGGYFLSEIPSIFFLLLTIWLSMRAREAEGRARILFAVGTGLAAGASLAVRPQLVLNVGIAAWVMLRGHPERRARFAAAAAGGLVVPVALVLALNTSAAGHFVGFSENGGFNFFQGHCPVNTVTTGNPSIGFLTFASPVVVETHRGRDYVFPDHLAWEQSYFVRQGLACIRHDGAGEIAVVARNVADLGITSTPWPMSADHNLRRFVKPINLAYSLVIPSVLVGAVYLARRRRAFWVWVLVWHLLAVLPTALVFYGDPRFRVPYDVFGLMLIAALISDAVGERGERDIPEAGRNDATAR